MNRLRRLLRNVPVLRFGAAVHLAVLIAASAPAVLKHLLPLKRYRGIPIVSPSEFLEQIG